MPRVVTLEELCAEPVGVIFSAYEPCVVSGLYRRGQVLRHPDGAFDFDYHALLAATHMIADQPADAKNHTFCNIHDGGQWGTLDPTELFVLYSPDDLVDMVQFLTGDVAVAGEHIAVTRTPACEVFTELHALASELQLVEGVLHTAGYAQVTVSRRSPSVLWVCVVDQRFAGLTREARMGWMAQTLDRLPPKVRGKLGRCWLFTPAEVVKDSTRPIDGDLEGMDA